MANPIDVAAIIAKLEAARGNVFGPIDRAIATIVGLNDPNLNTPVPGMEVWGYKKEGSNTLGFTPTESDKDNIFINTASSNKKIPHTIYHEREHLLQKRGGFGDPEKYASKFDELSNSKSGSAGIEVALNLVGERKYLKDKYGIDEAYFTPDALSAIGPRKLLHEQFASLASVEARTGKNLTDDPYLRRTVFNTKEKREAYNAMTGLRQTRLDSKDLPPYSKVEDKSTSSWDDFWNSFYNLSSGYRDRKLIKTEEGK